MEKLKALLSELREGVSQDKIDSAGLVMLAQDRRVLSDTPVWILGPSSTSVSDDPPWRVAKRTAKSVTLFSPSGYRSGARFAGKKYRFMWDGTGFKRQGQYLYVRK